MRVFGRNGSSLPGAGASFFEMLTKTSHKAVNYLALGHFICFHFFFFFYCSHVPQIMSSKQNAKQSTIRIPETCHNFQQTQCIAHKSQTGKDKLSKKKKRRKNVPPKRDNAEE